MLQEEGVLRGQELENAVLDADYARAIQLAFELRRPHKLFVLFSELCRWQITFDFNAVVEMVLLKLVLFTGEQMPVLRLRKLSFLLARKSFTYSWNIFENGIQNQNCVMLLSLYSIVYLASSPLWRLLR